MINARAQSELARLLAERSIDRYKPYPKQRLFHAEGLIHRERLLRAGNQLGKSYSSGAEAAYHATGEYPDWWEGRRWNKRTRGWVSAPSGELVRDGAQRILLGPVGEWGSGWLPKASIVDIVRSRGIPDLADTVIVKHVSGGQSRIKFKTYDQGRIRWQAETLEWVSFDEEPPEDIYTEGLTRTNATSGIVWLAFTPLLGMSEVVRRFLTEESPDRVDINMTLDDADHIPLEQRERIIASYSEHEREARTKGTPILGSGRIFPVAEEAIACDAFAIPSHWAQIGGLDIGWDHPTAAVRLAWDRDADVVYVTHTHRLREATPLIHAATLKPWGDWLPWAWPHDGLQHDKGSGEMIAQLYRKQGLRMLPHSAEYEGDRGNGVEAGLLDMLDRMNTGRFKVFRHLSEWFEEFRLYHRKDGMVVKLHDDLMSASRYGVMSLRFGKPAAKPPEPAVKPRPYRVGNSNWMGA
jgi:phage terminase large subunit-like protein